MNKKNYVRFCYLVILQQAMKAVTAMIKTASSSTKVAAAPETISAGIGIFEWCVLATCQTMVCISFGWK